MQSLGITPGTGAIRSRPIDRLFRRVTKRFEKQLEQAKMIEKHMASSPYKTIVCADMNNTQFSNVYRIIKGNLQDSFMKKGAGFGKTYNFLQVPLRIDFILADPAFKVEGHKNFTEKYSDHFPVMASFRLEQ
ncbi:MAG: hypothetical protein HKN31_11715 [Pricia sp.]|nr:hypothetical protein [Pricia sp.]